MKRGIWANAVEKHTLLTGTEEQTGSQGVIINFDHLSVVFCPVLTFSMTPVDTTSYSMHKQASSHKCIP